MFFNVPHKQILIGKDEDVVQESVLQSRDDSNDENKAEIYVRSGNNENTMKVVHDAITNPVPLLDTPLDYRVLPLAVLSIPAMGDASPLSTSHYLTHTKQKRNTKYQQLTSEVRGLE